MKRSFLSLFVLAFVSHISSAAVINVADHGIVPGKDVTLEVNRLIESLKGQPDVTLLFPKGKYDFYPENAMEAYRAVTNHGNSLKRMAMPLIGFDGLTIDGDGSTFMFRGRISPIVVDGSSGITLKNFSIDWDTPFHHEFRVVERDPKTNSFIVEISPTKYGYGDDTRYPLFAAPLLRPEQRLGDQKYHRNIRFTNNRIKSFNGHFAHARSVKGLALAGNIIERSTTYPVGSTRPSIELDYCEDVTIENNQFIGFDWPIRIESSNDTKNVNLKNNEGLSDGQSTIPAKTK